MDEKPKPKDDWKNDILAEDREEELIHSYVLGGERKGGGDDSGIVSAVLLKSRLGHHRDWDGNLPILFGSETELGFHIVKEFDLRKSRCFCYHPESMYPFFLRRVAEASNAFSRDPDAPWFRAALNHFDIERAKLLAKAAAEESADELPDSVKEKISEKGLSAKDFYFGEVGIFLRNASRLYADGGHLEYSIAECRDPREVICLEKAMESWIMQVKPEIEEFTGRRIRLLKDNTDRKGNSYACHTNFLLGRRFFEKIYGGGVWSKSWASFLVTSIIYTGAGKVGSECGREPCDFQISQRADHFSRMFGMDTMADRPIINFRDEALADDEKWGRLHVILHDSNMSELAIYLKMGVQALVLNMMQAHFYNKVNDSAYTKYILRRPVQDLWAISRDLTCKIPLFLEASVLDADGIETESVSPIKIQKVWYECAKRFYEARRYYPRWIYDVLWKWEQVLNWLEEDNPQLDRVLDWRIKKNICERLMTKRAEKGIQLTWQDIAIRDVDGLYHDLGPDGFYHRALKAGQVERIVNDAEIQKFRENAPEDTRAWARSQFIKHYLPYLMDVSWEMVAFLLKKDDVLHIPVIVELEPLKGTHWRVGNMFSRHLSFEAFSWDYVERFLNKRSPF